MPSHHLQHLAEEIFPAPCRRVKRCRVICAQSDAPLVVEGAGLRKYPVAGGQEVSPHVGILCEFRIITGDGNIESFAIPDGVVESADASSKALVFRGVHALHDGVQRRQITKKPCFLRHEVLFHAQVR